MSGGSAQGGRSSALGRLVARAGRPAVRAREDLLGLRVVDVNEAAAVSAPGAALPGRRVRSPREQGVELSPPPQPSRTAPFEAATMPALPALSPPFGAATLPALHRRVEAVTPLSLGRSVPASVRPGAGPEPDRRERSGASPPPLALPVEQPVSASETSAAATSPAIEDAPFPGALPTWTVVEPPAMRAGGPPVQVEARPEAAGWQALAQLEELDARTYGPIERQLGTVAPARAPTPERDPPPVIAGPSAPHALSAPVPRRGQQALPVPSPSGPAQVLIDRIEVITPAVRPSEPDPFLSLAARRVGASRHGGSA